jgi:RNA polymerase sigma-70 factor, ECF subfamily
MNGDTITTLVERAKTGDRLAFGELVERFQVAVGAIALKRLRDAAAAQELTQEVFIHALRKLPQLRDARCFPGWLRQITVRLALNRMARRVLNREVDCEAIDRVADRNTGPLENLERREAQRMLHAGLNRLKPLDRQALEVFYLRGHSLRRMSQDFGTPVGTLKRRLHTARQRLRELLETRRSAGAYGADGCDSECALTQAC